METLQTIWTALTTENEWLMNIVSIPFSIIELTVVILLSNTLLKLNLTK